MLHAIKYDGRRTLARRVGAMMRERGSEVLDGADLLVPVPLHWRRQLSRGFNQADDLARAIGGLPVVRALGRARPTRPQFGLSAAARHRNVREAFVPAGWGGCWTFDTGRRRMAARLRSKTVVLVDDVTTTGATLRACAWVLAGMGAREVRALTAARAVTLRQP